MQKHISSTGGGRNAATRCGMLWLAVFLLLLNAAFMAFSGCQSARDSGSTVTGRSLRFPTGQGIPFMRVLLDGKEVDRYQITDSTGSFAIHHVPVGTYKIFWANWGLSVYVQDLVINENDQVYVSDFPTLSAGVAELSGTVKSSDQPLRNVDIWMVYPGKGIAYASSNKKGEFSFTGLPDGEVTIVAQAPGYRMKVVEEVRVGFEGVDTLSVELDELPSTPTATVKGVVTDENASEILDGYVGAFPLSVMPSIYSVPAAEVLTGLEGYELKLPQGEYRFICFRSGFRPEVKVLSVLPGYTYVVDFVLVSEEMFWRDSSSTRRPASLEAP